MSRFLFVVPPLVGHVNPTVGVASCLAGLGHQVAWAGAAEALTPLIGADRTIYDCAIGVREVHRPPELRGPAALKFLWESFLVPLAEAMVPGVHAAVERFAPDVLVVDQQALAGALVADRLGLPWVTSATTSAELVDPLAGVPKVAAWLAELLGGLRARFGDPALDGDPRFSRSLILAFSSRALVGPTTTGPVAFVGPSIVERPSDLDVDWPSGDPDHPAVLVSLGTANADAGEKFLTACAQALAKRPVRAVVVDPAGVLGPQPPHVRLRPRVPQLRLLAGADAVLCHGGHNTVCESLWHGVPLVIAPIRDDQPIIAGQVVEAGAGLRLRFNRASAEVIGAAIDTVLAEPSYRDSARRVRDSFTAAGGAPRAARLLTELAAKAEERKSA
ncbi:MAG TPA: glycosyltransferase [Pseudonocardiaceae bacterium]|jgi:UDP:flavonoid glycosyltransferase YjiC (YdhE family)|nr:glycosyltransferase [Pseudonocardiaceae bacterium]